MKKRIFFLLLCLIIGGVIFGQNALAQFSIGISPLIFEITGNPGDLIENYIKVYNPSGDSVIQIEMQVEDIAPTGEAGQVIVEPAETESYSITRWVTMEPREFELQPGEEKFVKFAIRVPENAEPGGHYGTVLAASKSVSSPEGTGVGIVTRTGSLVLITVPGIMQEKLAVKDFSAPRYSEHGPILFEIKFENLGTIHVRPTGYVTVTNWLGQKVGDAEIIPRNVLPKGVRKFEASLYQKWFFAGKYTATLTGSYGFSNTPFTPVVITFWAFPWKIGLGILVIIILLVLSRKRWAAAFRILVKGEK